MTRGIESISQKPFGTERKERWLAYLRDFADHVFVHADEDENMSLDRTGGEQGFLEDALMVACGNPQKFKSELVDVIRSLSVAGASVLYDPIHHGGLYVDRFGEVMVSLEHEIDIDFSRSSEDTLAAKPIKMLMLTGPQAGREKLANDIDLAPVQSRTAEIFE